MDHILIISAVLLCFIIETIRIKVKHGKVVNINKTATKAIAVVLFIVIVVLGKTWQYGGNWFTAILFILLYGFMYGASRGVLYDPLLNVFALKRKWWADSFTTNSNGDRLEQRRKINTYQQRAMYLGLWIVCIALFEICKRM